MLLGLDTSRWEDNPSTAQTIDWQTVKSTGVNYVIMKATEGGTYTDPVYALHKANSAGILPRGSYHFWRQNVDAKTQAAHYWQVAGKMDMPPVLDVEDWYHDVTLRGAALEARIIEQLTEIDKLFGRPCILYTSPNIIKYYLRLSPSSPLCQRKLWIAHYGVTKPDIYPFQHWALWQYSERGSAAQYGIYEAASVDLNWYNGTLEDFRREMLGIDNQAGVYRILDDLEIRALGRPIVDRAEFIRDGLPSTVRMRGGSGGVLLSPAWMDYVYHIQGVAKYQFIDPVTLKPAVGWHNTGNANRVEQVVFSGNVVRVLEIVDNRAYIQTVSNADNPPGVLVKPTEANLHPLIHLLSTQYTSWLDMSTDGRYPRVMPMSNPGERLWIDTANLIKCPEVKVLSTATPYVNVRSAPGVSAPVIGKRYPGAVVTVIHTTQADGLLWGQILGGGWLALRYTTF